jgi:integrase
VTNSKGNTVNLVSQNVLELHQEVRKLGKVVLFLNSVKRNSLKTSVNYETSLSYLQSFLTTNGHTLESVLEPLSNNQINVYVLLEEFISYLTENKSLQSNSVRQYLVGIKSYLAYYDIDIIPSKFKSKVRLPKRQFEDQEPIDAKDIRNILLNCANRRLRTFILAAASSGARSSELLSTRVKDCDFSSSPTTIHLRKEYTKTRTARDIYISNEANKSLQAWISWKYRYRKFLRGEQRVKNDNDLVFQVAKSITGLQSLYVKLLKEWEKVLVLCGLNDRKEGMTRCKISFHSLRRYAKSVISNQVSSDYSEYLLGHRHSPYWTIKEEERKEIYVKKCMPHLTFLDYTALENTANNIVVKLEEKDSQIAKLTEQIGNLQYDLNSLHEVHEWADLVTVKNLINDAIADFKKENKLMPN